MSAYCKDCKFREKSNLPYDSFFCTHFKSNIEMLGCDEGESKAQTNADRIRNMTDEELAGYLHTIRYAWSCPVRVSGNKCHEHNDNCNECWLEWLKEEATDV